MPTESATAASSINSTASAIVFTIVQPSPSWRVYGSSPIVSPRERASAAIVRRPSTTTSRLPGPVRSTTALGWNGARRRRPAQYASTRSAGSSGPGIGSGAIEGTAGTAFVEANPLWRRAASRPSCSPSRSLNSQIPIPSAPASP
jgi:hypothetical protein